VASEIHASEFGGLLRHWRRIRGFSQLQLADRAGLSTRHLSFLETGRSGPSRGTVLLLARVLELPRPETERLLLVAGYAGDWGRGSADCDEVRRQLAEVAHLLAAHDPFPAVISDPDWRVPWQNRGARALFRRMSELSPALRADPLDLRQMLADEPGFARIVENRDELLADVLTGLYELQPDPASFGTARQLMDILPPAKRPCDAIGPRARTRIWAQPIRIRDLGARFSLELLTLPFAAAASGFALVLALPADAASRSAGERYFARLFARAA
jgi:transcriptional regulator with XRE-family HTH domain